MAKAAKKKKSSSKPRKQRAESDESVAGDHVRQLAPKSAVRSFINEVIATKARTSEAGQGLSTATKRATDAGINVPAARIAARIYSKGKQDPLKGRVLAEDVHYYLYECTDFDRIAPAGMFSAEEGGQKRKPKQAEMELPEQQQPPEQPQEQQAEAPTLQ